MMILKAALQMSEEPATSDLVGTEYSLPFWVLREWATRMFS